ncbi:MAG: hypothetical protein RBS92_00285 [Candidatus Cloacimonadales bacterium]|jgi:hypothetical protein|nr:hypothetical protein [Candidatus Cloacimonadales bacterium]HQB40259.1 hypothetical protein [Candidatus Cloacimonadota bacterium]
MAEIIKRPTPKNKTQIPMSIKIALLLAVILGIWLKSCWKNYQLDNILFENKTLVNPTPVSVDVLFTINNKTYREGKHRILIQVYTTKNHVISKKMTFVEIKAKKSVQYIKVLDNFNRPLEKDEELSGAYISLE